jgi:hypothetical protein
MVSREAIGNVANHELPIFTRISHGGWRRDHGVEMLHILVEGTLAILPVLLALLWLRRWLQKILDSAYNK